MFSFFFQLFLTPLKTTVLFGKQSVLGVYTIATLSQTEVK